jgi:hypothetical protein
MEDTSFDIYNLYDNVVYEYYQDTKILRVSWNRKDTNFHNFMKQERIPYVVGKKYNAYWVEELKRCLNWVEGNIIKLSIRDISRCNCNEFIIQVLDDRHTGYICELIDEDGYLCIRQYGSVVINVNNYKEYMKRCDCVYNEMVQQEMEPYILK